MEKEMIVADEALGSVGLETDSLSENITLNTRLMFLLYGYVYTEEEVSTIVNRFADELGFEVVKVESRGMRTDWCFEVDSANKRIKWFIG